MACNDHGLFLEIAQVIRRLDITILKGILENRSNTSWACFIVEVDKNMPNLVILNLITVMLLLNSKFFFGMRRFQEVFTGWIFYVLYCIFCSLGETVSHKKADPSSLYEGNVSCLQF